MLPAWLQGRAGVGVVDWVSVFGLGNVHFLHTSITNEPERLWKNRGGGTTVLECVARFIAVLKPDLAPDHHHSPLALPRGRARAQGAMPRILENYRAVGNGEPITGFLIHGVTKHRGYIIYKDTCVRLSFPVLPFHKEIHHHSNRIN